MELMDYSAARKRAFWLLSRKNYHSALLLKKLIDKGASEATAQAVIKDCIRLGFINDDDAILKELKKGWGPRAIEFRLRLKRGEARRVISREMQKQQISEMKAKAKNREKVFRNLQRKGFDIELLVEIFSFSD